MKTAHVHENSSKLMALIADACVSGKTTTKAIDGMYAIIEPSFCELRFDPTLDASTGMMWMPNDGFRGGRCFEYTPEGLEALTEFVNDFFIERDEDRDAINAVFH